MVHLRRRCRRRASMHRRDLPAAAALTCFVCSRSGALAISEASWPAFERQTSYRNLSASVAAVGGCAAASGTASSSSASPLRAAGRVACALGCQAHEDVLAESFEPWFDHKISVEVAKKTCAATQDSALAFIGAVSQGRVFWKCCSKGGRSNPDICTGSPMQVEIPGVREEDFTDRDALLMLIAEVVEAAHVPDVYFTFNIGDQPFTDKMYWSPIPQFHFVKCHGHWSIPFPNPYHLRAHLSDRLGDNEALASELVPWNKKKSKVFWRGSLSAPDKFSPHDLESLPRIRLLMLAKEHPELFDVAITDVDPEMYHVIPKKELDKFLKPLRQTGHVNSRKAMPRCRYIINVSAVLSSWRLAEMLASGSVLLLQEDSSRELIYEWMTPWEHFVPISNNLSDLVAKVRWLEEHPEEAQAIADRGYTFFTQRVRRQDTYCYLWQALSTLAASTESKPLATPQELMKTGYKEVKHEVLQRIRGHVPMKEMVAQGLRSSEL